MTNGSVNNIGDGEFNMLHQKLALLGEKQRLLEQVSFNALLISYQLQLIKMRAEVASLNHCAVPFLSRAAVNLSWHYSTCLEPEITMEICIMHILNNVYCGSYSICIYTAHKNDYQVKRNRA